MTIDITNLQPD